MERTDAHPSGDAFQRRAKAHERTDALHSPLRPAISPTAALRWAAKYLCFIIPERPNHGKRVRAPLKPA
jgi:hypothetical protein